MIASEVLDFLPVFERSAISVENSLIDLEQSCLLDTSVIVGFVVEFDQEGLEVDGDSQVRSVAFSGDRNVEKPFFLEVTQFLGEVVNNEGIDRVKSKSSNIERNVCLRNSQRIDGFSVSEVVISSSSHRLLKRSFEDSLDVFEGKFEFPNTINWFLPGS